MEVCAVPTPGAVYYRIMQHGRGAHAVSSMASKSSWRLPLRRLVASSCGTASALTLYRRPSDPTLADQSRALSAAYDE